MKSLQASTWFPSSHLLLTKRNRKKKILFKLPLQRTTIHRNSSFEELSSRSDGHRAKTNRSTKPKKEKKPKKNKKGKKEGRKKKRKKDRFNFNYHVKGIPQSSSQVADTDCIKESPPLTRPMKGGQRVAGWGRQFSTGFPRKPTSFERCTRWKRGRVGGRRAPFGLAAISIAGSGMKRTDGRMIDR